MATIVRKNLIAVEMPGSRQDGSQHCGRKMMLLYTLTAEQKEVVRAGRQTPLYEEEITERKRCDGLPGRS